jgi:hypothetical protein
MDKDKNAPGFRPVGISFLYVTKRSRTETATRGAISVVYAQTLGSSSTTPKSNRRIVIYKTILWAVAGGFFAEVAFTGFERDSPGYGLRRSWIGKSPGISGK